MIIQFCSEDRSYTEVFQSMYVGVNIPKNKNDFPENYYYINGKKVTQEVYNKIYEKVKRYIS